MQNKRCFNCVHYRGKLECNAFTGGIPEEILLGEDKHIKKHPKQKNDILFKQIDKGSVK